MLQITGKTEAVPSRVTPCRITIHRIWPEQLHWIMVFLLLFSWPWIPLRLNRRDFSKGLETLSVCDSLMNI